MIVTVKATITAVAQVSQGDIIFNTGAVPVYVDTIQANVISAPLSSATPVLPGQSIQWAGTPGLLYARDPTGSSPGIGVTSHTGLPFPAPVGGPQYLFRSYGLLLYNGTPGHGNLCGIFVSPNEPPTDDFGNPLASVLRIGTNLNVGPHFGVESNGDMLLNPGANIVFYGKAGNGGLYFYQLDGSGNQSRVASISPDSNPDPLTNASIIQGMFAYGAPVFVGGLSPAVGLTASRSGPVILLFRAGGGHESGTHAALETAVSFANAANEIIVLTIQGPATIGTNDSIEMQFASSPNNAPGANQAFARIGWLSPAAAFTQLQLWDAGGVQRQSVGGISGGVPLSIISTTQHTANTTSFLPVTDSVNIPANDQFSSAAQTTYRLRFSGTGGWPNPGVSGEFRVVAFGQSIDPFSGDNFSAGFMTAGHGFWFFGEISITVKTIGALGTGFGVVSGFVCFNDMSVVSSISTWIQQTPVIPQIDTTVANPFSIQWGFNAGPNGGTLTSIYNEFTRTENPV